MSPRSPTLGPLLALLVSIVVLAGCFDRVAAPPLQVAPVPRHDFLADANWGQNNSAQAGSWDGDLIDSVRGGFKGPPQPLGPFPYPTFLRVSVSGLVSQVPRAFPGTNIVRNAYAAPGDPYFWGAVGFTSNGSMWFALAPETVLRVVAPITPFRNDAGGQPIGDWSHCGMPGYTLCWTWAGTAHLEFERLPADLTLQQSPDTAIWAGQSVTFTAGADPATVAGNPWPIGVMELRWRWIPDDTVSADTLGCGATSGMKCTRVMRGSGTMYAAAYVNGQQQQKSVDVVLKVPTLTLTASKYSLAAPGENVTFSVTGNGPVTVLGWSFDSTTTPTLIRVPSSGPLLSKPSSGSSSTAKLPHNVGLPLSISSVLKPVEKVAVSRGRTSRLAVPSSSLKLAGPGSSWGNCGASSTQCTNYVGISGTVDVLAIVHGDTLRASVQVNVVPCPTGDPLLDHPYIRKMLDSLWRLSWPDTTNTTNRIERGAYIYYDSVTKKSGFVISPSSGNDDACQSHLGAPPPYTQVVRVIHTHPARGGEYVQCNPTTGHRYATQFGKPSDADWAFAKEANDLNPGHGVIGWIIDQDDIVTYDPEGLIIERVPQPRGDTASVPKNWQSRNRNYYQRRQPGCTLP